MQDLETSPRQALHGNLGVLTASKALHEQRETLDTSDVLQNLLNLNPNPIKNVHIHAHCNGPIRIPSGMFRIAPSCAVRLCDTDAQVARLGVRGCANDVLRVPIRQVIGLGFVKIVCPQGAVHVEEAVFESTRLRKQL